jgi:hypothetical protein
MSTCCICLNNLRATRSSTELSCGHLFHKSCIDGWKGTSCPLCRRDVLPPRFSVKVSIENLDTRATDVRELDMTSIHNLLETLNISNDDLVDYSTEIVFDVDNIDDIESVMTDLGLDMADFNSGVFDTEGST